MRVVHRDFIVQQIFLTILLFHSTVSQTNTILTTPITTTTENSGFDNVTDLKLSTSAIFTETEELEQIELDTTTYTVSAALTCNSPSSTNGINIETLVGDILVTVIGTHETITTASNLVLKQLPIVYQNGSTITIGIRSIILIDDGPIESLIMDEIKYLQNCVVYSIGIFLQQELWSANEEFIKSTEFNIWPILSRTITIYPKIVHLLHEIPWDGNKFSIEIESSDKLSSDEFKYVAEDNNFCITPKDAPQIIYVVLDVTAINKIEATENSTIIYITYNKLELSLIEKQLPEKSYIIKESEVLLSESIADEYRVKKNLKQSQSILISELVPIASLFLDVNEWLKEHLQSKLCTSINIDLCRTQLLDGLMKDKYIPSRKLYKLEYIVKLLNLQNLTEFMNIDMMEKWHNVINSTYNTIEYRPFASVNYLTNVTIFYHYKETATENFEYKVTIADTIPSEQKLGLAFKCSTKDSLDENITTILISETDIEMYWRVKPEAWIAAGLTISLIGILLSLTILCFVVLRIFKGDILEGNPTCSITLLIALIVLFGSFVPFCIEYHSPVRRSYNSIEISIEAMGINNSLCASKLFLITISYCFVFSLLLCRGLMLASIGTDGGFLSHVNGYIQSVICIFSTLVQLGVSTQLIVFMHVAHKSVSCTNLLFGNWFWGLLAYDGFLLIFVVILTPFIFRSQRNYKEGLLIVIGSILCFIVWCTWIPLSIIDLEWREMAIALGAQATGWAILGTIMIPRSFLIVRGLARSDLAQALPSLSTLAFVQNNQHQSNQSVYECVNPTIRQSDQMQEYSADLDRYDAMSEIPTLPLRAARLKKQERQNSFSNRSYSSSDRTSMSPTKAATRF